MHLHRSLLGAALLAILPAFGRPLAQGVTTALISGTVRAPADRRLDGARVEAINRATGFRVTSEVRDGRFNLAGLEVGVPYDVTVQQIGFTPQRRSGVYLALGDRIEMHFVLQPIATRLDTVYVVRIDTRLQHRAIGTSATIPDSLLHRLPTLNRDLYDFVRLVPQVSTRVTLAGGGLSAGGVGLRFNNFLVDGAPERALSGNSPVAFSGGKSVPIDAVQEYQVLVAPYDVRYGDFAGALINTVTRSGTNELHGTAFGYARDGRLSRLNDAPYDREQYGFTLGGPLVRDRLHFFVAPEVQRLTAPARGPYVGQAPTASPPVPVSAADIARFTNLLQGYGLTAGSAGMVHTGNPLTNLFGRLDLTLPGVRSRAVASVNYARFAASAFTRDTGTFTFSSYRSTQESASRLASFQLHTNLRRNAYNELLASYRTVATDWTPDAREPIIQVAVPGLGQTPVILKAGSQEQAQGVLQRARIATLTDNVTVSVGSAHELTIGAQIELFRLALAGVANGYGTWSFANLDSLERGVAQRFEAREELGGASRPIVGRQAAFYMEDGWRITDRFAILAGARGDVLYAGDPPPYNRAVDSLFGRRTDVLPPARVHLSPRGGFRWDVGRGERDQLRGGVGLFTGRPPLAWQLAAITSYGAGIANLRCGFQAADGGAPRFVPDYNAVPTACATGRRGAGDVDLLDPHLRMAQTLRASLAYDRTLPWEVIATAEGLVTRNVSDFVFMNLNLQGPQGVDRHGRVLYGAINSSGQASPVRVSSFSEVIDLRNTSRNHSYQLSATLQKRFSGGFAGTTSYTYSHVRDAQSPIRAAVPAFQNWSSGRTVSGRHDDLMPGVSLNDLPHRVVVAMTYAAPWRRWTTDLSMYYLGESGSPFTYVAGGVGLGDLNADGAARNDPIYVPRSAFDASEIIFSGSGADTSSAASAQRILSQQSAFEQLVATTPCLRRQRGRIMARNSCREPWGNTTIASVRQRMPSPGGRALTAQLDVFNVLNLLRQTWGLYRTAPDPLLVQVSQADAGSPLAQPVFAFDATRPHWTVSPLESAYQLQLALRYSF